MNDNIMLCGSSSLLDSNREWEKIKENYNLTFASYGDFMSPLLNADDNAIVMVLFFEDLVPDAYEDLSSIQNRYIHFFDALESHHKSSKQPIIICWGKTSAYGLLSGVKRDGREKLAYDWFYGQLTDLKKKLDSVYLVDLSEIFYSYGINSIFSDRNWYFARCRLSIEGLAVLIDAVALVINRCFNPPSKVLVLDCDNTIWGGVIGEDGLQGITLGQDGIGTAFVDFQKEVIRLVNEGVIVVLASKNNEEDVWKVFSEHGSMQLKRDHVVTYRINWDEKAFNLKEMANELDLNIDSFVFWDDSPFERDKMKTLLPQVLTIDPPQNVFEWPRFIRSLQCFAKFETTKDDKQKLSQYKARAQFSSDIKQNTNIDEYLRSINLTPNALSLDDSNVSRAEQLCKKTNQFNLRTKRHSVADLKNFRMTNDDFIFLVHLKDDYGDHGLVALVCLEQIGEHLIFIDTFLMSCRVLGRHLEAWILSDIIRRLSKLGVRYLVTEFIETDRNEVARGFLDSYGFVPVKSNTKLAKIITDEQLNGGQFVCYLDTENVKIPNMEIYERSASFEPS